MKVNGMMEEIKDGITLDAYLYDTGYSISKIVVELNGEIISKANYAKTILFSGDSMEVVHFVGGG